MQDQLRMTVSRARAIMEKHDAHLSMGQWGPSSEDPKGYCSTGLYILDKLGEQPISDNDRDWPFAKNIEKMGYDSDDYLKAMCQKIADLTGVPFVYLVGLNNGFEKEEYRLATDYDDGEVSLYDIPLDYVVGYADGQMLLTQLFF